MVCYDLFRQKGHDQKELEKAMGFQVMVIPLLATLVLALDPE